MENKSILDSYSRIFSFTKHFWILLLLCLMLPWKTFADSFEPYRIDGINPKCVPVSAPACFPIASQTDSYLSHSSRGKRDANSNGNKFNHNYKELLRKRRNIPAQNPMLSWRYNITTFPNFANDRTPAEVADSLRHFHPLLTTECSAFVRMFLCSVYSPVCTPHGVVPPCKELCERVRNDCKRTVEIFGITWPASLECSLFPSYGDSSSISEPRYYGSMSSRDDDFTIMIQRAATLTWMEALAGEGKICIPPLDRDVITPQIEDLERRSDKNGGENKTSGHESPTVHGFGLWCPAEMRSPPGQSGYTFLGMQNCSPPCPNMYLGEGELTAVRYVIMVLASLCILVTFFTICTFLINRRRFRYPERPIVFYALSYLIVSVIFMTGFIMKEEVACNEEIRDENTNDIIQGFTVVKGDHKQSCTIMFMILYFFTVNGTIWWLILTFTWLLAAGFKWGSEAIEHYSVYYHLVAWGIPSIQTMVVVTFSKIEGDNISGVCFLGLYDSVGLLYMLLTPLCIYLFIGIIILLTGFICLNRVRKSLQNDEVNKRKLAKFMVRIGVFSVMYIVPQVILFIIYIVEHQHRSKWEATWFLTSCSDYRVPCPTANSTVTIIADGYQPNVILFVVKYIMTLIVALPPLFWVASKKTMLSWKIFCCRIEESKTTSVAHHSNNVNHIVKRDAQKKLLKEQKNKRHWVTPAGEGNTEKEDDDVFFPFKNSKLQGSSASVAAMAAAAAAEMNSRQNSIIQHRPSEVKGHHSGSETGSLSRQKSKERRKEFPESRKLKAHHVTSSGSTSSRAMTPSINKPASSLSSSTSAQRRAQSKLNNNLQPHTSSLNRNEFLASRAPGAVRKQRSASPMTSSLKTSKVVASDPNVMRSLSPQGSKTTVVSLTGSNFEGTAEV